MEQQQRMPSLDELDRLAKDLGGGYVGSTTIDPITGQEVSHLYKVHPKGKTYYRSWGRIHCESDND